MKAVTLNKNHPFMNYGATVMDNLLTLVKLNNHVIQAILSSWLFY